MLTSIATIAAAVSALVAVGMKVYKSIKIAQVEKRIKEGRSIEQQILEAKTNEERAQLARDLDNHSK